MTEGYRGAIGCHGVTEGFHLRPVAAGVVEVARATFNFPLFGHPQGMPLHCTNRDAVILYLHKETKIARNRYLCKRTEAVKDKDY